MKIIHVFYTIRMRRNVQFCVWINNLARAVSVLIICIMFLQIFKKIME